MSPNQRDRVSEIEPSPSLRHAGGVSLLVLALTGLLAACAPVTAGKEGRLYFQFVGEDALVVPAIDAAAVAAGANIDVAVFADSDRTPATVTAASSSDPAVLEVRGTEGHQVLLAAGNPGVLELSVETGAGADRIELTVEALGSVDISAPQAVASSGPAYVVEGGVVRLGYRLLSASGARLVGYGLYPITVVPAEAAAIVPTEDLDHLSVAVNAPGMVELVPANGASVTLEAVPQAEVRLDGLESPNATLPIGESMLVMLRASRATDGQPVVGLTGLVEVTATGAACEVRPSLDLPTSDDTFVVRGLTSGPCEVQATLGAQAVELTLAVE